MTAGFGGLLAMLGAFCYALGSVAIAKSSQSAQGRGNDVFISVLMTAVASGVLWLLLGPELPVYGNAVLIGIVYFVVAGLLGNVLGRLTLFRSVELAGAIETGFIRRLIPVFAAVFAFLFLGELITPTIVIAFLLVTGGVLIMMTRTNLKTATAMAVGDFAPKEKNKGRVMAFSSAAGYGASFVSRKLAMQTLPDPLAGVFIGAMTGLLWFAASAGVRLRNGSVAPLRIERPSGWQLLAGGAMTIGQVALFFSLMFTSVTVVAIISSVEMFFAAWLAGHVFKTERRPGRKFYIAATLAGSGVVLLAVAPGLA
ncbi:MAG: EamA family transporter [Roseovarius sp.]|jgi:drug/metabolite transporter (DMT)-like permease|uniref:Membrane protein n=1 Tax=Marinibacterium profundimaris TaxID=1679460 RepID=A0A225NCG6_9RHOB|nr:MULTISPECIES: DMT family transporter [Rhodobacterales]OWU67215.1 membrane protein [Marinibacterium profundimaris]